MAIKHGYLLVFSAPFQTDGSWVPCIVSVKNDGTLYIISESQEELSKVCKTYTITVEWFIIAPRLPSSTQQTPALPKNKAHCELFALTQPPETTIWFLTSSKVERDEWVEAILPLTTLSLAPQSTPPPPYREYDNWPHSRRPFCFPAVISQPKSDLHVLPLPSRRSKTYTIQKGLNTPIPTGSEEHWSACSTGRSKTYDVQKEQVKSVSTDAENAQSHTNGQYTGPFDLCHTCCPFMFFPPPGVNDAFCCYCCGECCNHCCESCGECCSALDCGACNCDCALVC